MPDDHPSQSILTIIPSITMDNSLSPSHTLVQIVCQDHKGLLYDIMWTLKDYNVQISYGRGTMKQGKKCEIDLLIMQADGKKIVEPSKQNALRSHLEKRTSLSSQSCRVFYDITHALKMLDICIFTAEVGRHIIQHREWEVYRVLLHEQDCLSVPRRKIKDEVWKALMGGNDDDSNVGRLPTLSSLYGFLKMAGREENRIFVGGLGWNTTERHLQGVFSRYGKVLDCLVMSDRDTGRPRGFGFITFADRRAMEDAIRDMHGREMDGRVISVNRAEPKLGAEDPDYGHSRDHISGGRDSFRGGRVADQSDECFKCGRSGHWARDCPSSIGSGKYSSKSAFGRGGFHGDRVGGDRYDDRFDGGRYGDRDHLNSKERYGSHYTSSRESYPPVSDRFGSDRYLDRDPPNGYGRDRGYERDNGVRVGDRYGAGGPTRFDRGSYRDKLGPYDRPRRSVHASSYDRY
ncbi:hypothetical protein Ancab_014522 [Ancistrocladus abbreviatus]